MPWKIGRQLVGHDCEGVVRAGLAGRKNGGLLKLASAAGYDVLLTVDHGIPYQQQLQGLRIALVIIYAQSNKIEILAPRPGCARSAAFDLAGASGAGGIAIWAG